MSDYKGIAVQRLSNGEIYSVVVITPPNHKSTMEPDEYVRRGIKPPIDTLPTQEGIAEQDDAENGV